MKKTIDEIREDLNWLGFVEDVIDIEEYQIAKYVDKTNKKTYYHPYYNGHTMSVSYHSIEECMVGMIARKMDGPNTRIDTYFMNALKYEQQK